MPKKLTVVTPSFAAARTIESTIRSVVEQCYPNLEYLVVDGGSTDGTVEIIKRYESQLTHWETAPDGGQYDAINKGFARSTGDILCWLNADDMFLPRALWIVAEIFDHFPEVEWISTLKPGAWDANSYFTGTHSMPGFAQAAFLDGLYLPGTRRSGYWIQQESTFWRRSLWDKAGRAIPSEFSLAGDFALWANFYRHAELYGVDYPLAGFRTLQGQRSEDISRYAAEAQQSLTTLRNHLQWEDGIKSKLRYGSLVHLPRLGSTIKSRLGYVGSKIVNKNPRKAGSGWAVQSYRFLP